ncbi:MAG: leucine--tRNA ligase [Patescibacteria group bacterium]
MKKYSPQTIEKKWQKKWKAQKLYETADAVSGKENFYKLVEFPYPSGNLHMGHWYSFAVPDIFARYKRMKGYNVLYPMGFDAFGLPAENAAIKNNLQPGEWTKQNIKTMTKQMESMGAMFDWSRMVSTIDPDYYRWTQWIFIQFYKAGLAYRAKTLVNWCPKDKTVLANEQVVDGKCERCGSDVEQREREQWMYRITKYADALVDGLEKVDWPEVTKTAQRNWVWDVETGALRLHDWILSRQRYWGTPIPMIICKDCGYHPVPEEKLPVKLPKLENYLPVDDGSSPLARAEKWVNAKCPNCGKNAKRETDTMDTFVDSSWYYLAYATRGISNFQFPISNDAWNPVDLYTGGAEHNTMHLLYSRFFIKALHDLKLVDFDEPFTIRRNHGTVLGPDGAKMSKSKGNIIDPDKEVAQFGADAVRMYLAFLGPYDTFNGPWTPQGITGISRFLNKVWKLAHEEQQETNQQRLHQAIKKVSEDIEALHFNTAISELMKLLNEREVIDEAFLKLLAPFAPHLAEELWSRNHSTSIHLELFPVYDPRMIQESMVDFVIQVNGKTRGVIQLPVDSDESAVRSAAEKDDRIKRHLTSTVKKVIFVKGRLCNFIL